LPEGFLVHIVRVRSLRAGKCIYVGKHANTYCTDRLALRPLRDAD